MRLYRCVDCGTDFPAGEDCPHCARQVRRGPPRRPPRRDDDDEDGRRYDVRRREPDDATIWPSFGGVLLGGTLGILLALPAAPLAVSAGEPVPWIIAAVLVLAGGMLFTWLFTSMGRRADPATGLGGGMLGGSVGGTLIGGSLAYMVLVLGLFFAGCAGAFQKDAKQREALVAAEEERAKKRALGVFGSFVLGGAVLGGAAGLAGTLLARSAMASRRREDEYR
ncbi:MAG: hypothetical protein K2W96_14700 [Gemmataceae bacterium]|nr:hypothetical protein [Gemmataceae bacterium]